MAREEIVRVPTFQETQRADESILFQQILRLLPGTYHVAATVRDVGSTSESHAQADYTAPSFAAGTTSGPILAYQATGRGSLTDPLNLVLNPRGSVGYGSDTLLAYIEGYNFTKPTTVPFKVVDEQQNVVHQNELHFRGGHPVESQVVRLSPDSVALGELKLVVGEGETERKVSALVSFTNAWVVTNFDEMLDLLRYFGHDDEVNAMRKAPESERARLWREFYVATDPNNSHAGERGAQRLLQPHRAGQSAVHRRGCSRLAHRPWRGLREPWPARRSGREHARHHREPDPPLDLHQSPARAVLPRRERLRAPAPAAEQPRGLRAHPVPAAPAGKVGRGDRGEREATGRGAGEPPGAPSAGRTG